MQLTNKLFVVALLFLIGCETTNQATVISNEPRILAGSQMVDVCGGPMTMEEYKTRSVDSHPHYWINSETGKRECKWERK